MQNTIPLSATLRTDYGKGYARRLRAAHQIPAVIYGHGEAPEHVALPGHETMLAARHANAVLSLNVEGSEQLVIIKDIQRHPIRPEILHVDLIRVRRGERVEVEVPLNVEGEVDPTAAFNVEEIQIAVEADALNVPENIVVNISGRKAGEHVLAKDLVLPEGVTLVADEDLLIVNVSEPETQDLGEESAEESAEAAE